jgi:hypothetical protein
MKIDYLDLFLIQAVSKVKKEMKKEIQLQANVAAAVNKK